jgi:hypothetical protein
MSLNHQKYHAFAILLEQLRLDAASNQLDAPKLREGVLFLQKYFQQEIVPLLEESYREQSYRTEISKQLRLLDVDAMFFQGAKQAATAQARLQTIGSRLTTLIQYCEAVTKQDNGETS